MQRAQILNQIRTECEARYITIDNWIHDIYHIKRVVAEGRKLCVLEGVKPKDAFLVEIACWLHDLGRVGEPVGLEFGVSGHAERSYEISKQVLKPYERFLGRESVYKILQAVREHSLPVLKHAENTVSRLLQDADRGAGLNLIGIYTMIAYYDLAKVPPIHSNTQAKQLLDDLTEKLHVSGNVEAAIAKLRLYKDWYYGCEEQIGTGVKVEPLHTKSAYKHYKQGMKEIEHYIERLEAFSQPKAVQSEVVAYAQ